jgi:squalene-associated FAD-dependent desaturase
VDADVIVIGAGFAGLSAATALAEQRRRVLVLEARPALGGRATAFTDPATGERVDNGQHVLFGCYHETFRFLRRIGTQSDVLVQPQLSIDTIDLDGRAARLTCPALPSPFHLLTGLLMWDAIGWRDRLAVLRMRGAIRELVASSAGRSSHGGRAGTTASSRERGIGDETVREWLLRHGQTSRLIERLWEPLAVAALNQPIDVAAVETFLGVLARVLGKGPRDASLALPLRPLDELYAVPARRYIERMGGVVQTGAVARVDATRNAPVVTVGDRRLTARAVVCAVPWYSLDDVFPGRPTPLAATLESAAHTDASPIVTVNLWFDRVVTDQMFVGLPGRTMQWVFDKRMVFGARASHLSLVSSGAASVVARSNQELIDLALEEVRGALPAAHSAVMMRGVVVRERRATFSVAPGQPSRPQAETGVPGLVLAGDWTDTGLPSTIEGAVVSGHRAAAVVLAG